MEQEIIGIAQKSNTRNINERIAITELLEMGASWMGMVACWWATMLMQGGIFFTNLETKDCLFVIVIFLFICFRHRLYFCPQATWSLTEASRSLWTNNIQQLALSIGCISRLFYWCKLFSAIPCAVLSMIQIISQDFGQTEVPNMATRNFALKVFYVLALIEAVLLLLAFLSMLFERAKKENKEHKVERAKEENKEHKEEEKDDAEHKIIEIHDQTSTGIQQQDSSNPMLNNNDEGTSHTLTSKGAPEKFFFKENTRDVKSWKLRAQALTLLALVANLLLLMVFLLGVIMQCRGRGHMFLLETKELMFISLFGFISSRSLSLQVDRYMLGNNIQQHISGLLYWFRLVSALIWAVLSLMGLVSQYYGQTEVTKRISQHFVLRVFYWLTFAEALLSVLNIRNIRIMTMLQTFIDTITGWQTDQIKKFRQKYRRMVPTKASEHPVAFIPEQEKCKIIEKKTK